MVEALRERMHAVYRNLGRDPGVTRADWVKAGADYYVALHPEDARWRPTSTEEGIPSVDEIRDRSAAADRAHKAIPHDGRITMDKARHELWMAQVPWAEETFRGVYTDGFRRAVAAIKAGDASGLEYCVRFLEADPWCFRSGYMKAELIPAITQFELDEPMRQRLRLVVIAIVDDARRRREIGRYGTLARAVATIDLRAELEQRTMAADPQVRFNAARVLEKVHQLQSPSARRADGR
jgi:hypothetical protein